LHSVGAGGHVLHGGFGYASHTYGLAMDLLLEAQVVLANGSVVSASKTQNADLFWALRGAGSSFGVVTNMKFQTFAAPTSITVFSYTYEWDEAQAVTALTALQDYANSSSIPAEMNMRLAIGPYSTKLGGVFYGTQAAFQSAIAPLVTKIGSPQLSSVQDMDWIGMLNNFAYMPLTTSLNYNSVSAP
jgi:FAD/FMN-containing dehydrogenase